MLLGAVQTMVVEGFNEQISQQKPFFVTLQLKDGCNKGWPLRMHFKCAPPLWATSTQLPIIFDEWFWKAEFVLA